MYDLLPFFLSRSGAPILRCTICCRCFGLEAVPGCLDIRFVAVALVSKWCLNAQMYDSSFLWRRCRTRPADQQSGRDNSKDSSQPGKGKGITRATTSPIHRQGPLRWALVSKEVAFRVSATTPLAKARTGIRAFFRARPSDDVPHHGETPHEDALSVLYYLDPVPHHAAAGHHPPEAV